MWKTVKLGDVCTIKTGKKDVNEGNQDGAFPFYTCAKEHTYSDSFSFDCEAILIAGNGVVGQTTYYKGKFEAYQRTYVLCEFHTILPKLLLFILQGKLMQHLSSMVLGNTMPYIKKGMLQEFEFPLPPLAEQQRIVAKLDAAFEEIDKKTAISKTQLLESTKLKDVLIASMLSAFLEYKPLEDICEFLNGYAFKSADTVDFSDTQLLRMGNLYDNKLDLNRNPVFYPNSYSKTFARYVLNNDDIVMTLTGTVGKQDYGYALKIENTNKILLLNQRILKLHKFKECIINQTFLLYCLQSVPFLEKLYPTSNGTRQANLSSDTIKKLTIPLPSLEEQIECVRIFDIVSDSHQKLINCLSEKLCKLTSLKTALLAQELQPREAA